MSSRLLAKLKRIKKSSKRRRKEVMNEIQEENRLNKEWNEKRGISESQNRLFRIKRLQEDARCTIGGVSLK